MTNDPENIIERLKRVDCFSRLDEESLRLIGEKMTTALFRQGEVIFSEGDPADRMFVVKSGQVRVLKRGDGPVAVPIDVLQPGDFGGVTSLFLRKTRSATLRAIEDVELWVLEQATFEQLLDSDPAFARSLLTYMSGNARREARIVAKLSAKDGETGFRVAVFDTKPYTRETFLRGNTYGYHLAFFEHRLTPDTVTSAMGYRAVCAFVNDRVDVTVVERLHEYGVELIAMRCAGYNNVDLAACEQHGISVVHVPAYSPQSVAEHSLALALALNRKIPRAHARVRDGNFSLDGLVGFEMRGKTVGILGTGRVGKCAADIFLGLGCRVLGYDIHEDQELRSRPRFSYASMDDVIRRSDIISLHIPLIPKTHHLINAETIARMKPGVMIINTSRGGLVDTQALVDGLKTGHVGSAGLDVYEEENEYFFEDYSGAVIADDLLARLLTFNNVIVTSHQAFLTQEALESIARMTFESIREFQEGLRGKGLARGICPACAAG